MASGSNGFKKINEGRKLGVTSASRRAPSRRLTGASQAQAGTPF